MDGLLPAFPFDLPGPVFLQLYICSLIIGFLAARYIRNKIVEAGSADGSGVSRLSPYEAAWLLRGSPGLAQALMAGMTHAGMAEAKEGEEVIRKGPRAPHGGAHYLELDIHNRLLREPEGLDVNKIIVHVANHNTRLLQGLMEKGYWVSPAKSRAAAWAATAIFAPVVIAGVLKIIVGVERDKPVGFLAALAFIAFCLMLFLRRSAVGMPGRLEKELRRWSSGLKSLKTTAETKPSMLSANDMALAAGLFGPAIFAASMPLMFERLGGYMHPQQQRTLDNSSASSTGSSCGSSSGGDSGGDSGSSGCGGCGGGCGGGD
ncbi:MAG: hypothetical protein GMKNLPBB_02363 [Myxococcota bacterium]|nr:hypothetical protein [Myxococcota bacterium]